MKPTSPSMFIRAGRFGWWLALGWSTALLWGCQVQQSEEPARAPAPVPASGRVLTEHRPLVAPGTPSKSVGEDCTTYGQTECLSGLCLHAKPQRNGGYFCSQTCRSAEECPEQWRCAQMMPGSAEAGVCQPPPSWVSAVAQPRAPFVPNKSTSP